MSKWFRVPLFVVVEADDRSQAFARVSDRVVDVVRSGLRRNSQHRSTVMYWDEKLDTVRVPSPDEHSHSSVLDDLLEPTD